MTSRIIWCPGAVTIMISSEADIPISVWERYPADLERNSAFWRCYFHKTLWCFSEDLEFFLSWNALRACLVYYVYIKHTIFYFALNNKIYGMTHLGMVKFSQFSTKFKSSLIQVLTIARLSTLRLKLSKLGKVKQDSF